MDLSIIIVNWNTKEMLAACLESVEAAIALLPELQSETFVVDNGSTDGSQAMLKNDFPWVSLIENQTNVGFGAANNQAIANATGHYVMLLNSDTEVQPGAFEILLNFMNARPDAGATGPLLLNTDGTLQLSCDREPTLPRELWRLLHLDKVYYYGLCDQASWPRDQHRRVDVVKGACMFICRGVLDQVGLFDEEFFMYSEEVDFCTRIRQAGWEIYWVPQAKVVHHGGQSTKLVAAEMFQNLYKYKLLYFRKTHGAFSAQLYKAIVVIGALARVTTVPIAARLGSQSKRGERLALAANYRRLLTGLPRL